MDNASSFYFKGRQSSVKTDSLLPLDNDWVRSSFLISLDDFPDPVTNTVDKYALKYMYWSSASLKFTNTSMGGNLAINAKPQFCRYADIRVKGLMMNRHDVSINNALGSNGMGSYYSEAFDDNAQRIYLRFGVPQFNSLLNFISTMFDSNLSSLSNTGAIATVLGGIAFTITRVAVFRAFFPMSAIFMAGKMILNTFNNKSISSFYSVRPTMPLYWSAVNEMVNTISVLRGILPPSMIGTSALSPGASDYALTNNILKSLKELMPDVINEQYGIDVFALANKVQRINNKINDYYDAGAYTGDSDADKNPIYNATNSDPKDQTVDGLRSVIQNSVSENNNTGKATTLADLVKLYNVSLGGKDSGVSNASPTMMLTLDPEKLKDKNTAPTTDTSEIYNTTDGAAGGLSIEGGAAIDQQIADAQTDTYRDTKGLDKFTKYFNAEAQTGGGYACFVVESTGSVSDSFSNSFEDSKIASTLNGISSSARSISYNVANGNLVPGMADLLAGAKHVAMSALDGVALGGIARLLLGSYLVDIPKFWSGSTASLGKTDYTIELNSPYGNAISQLQNIYIPLSMILVGALPLSAGRQTYTSPFLCQLFDRGKAQVTLGMIDNISITRGTTNLAFNKEYRPLGLKVSFSIVNLNNIMHVPVSKGTFFSALLNKVATTAADITTDVTGSQTAGEVVGGFLATSLTDDDGLLFNYLSTVVGVSARDNMYKISRARLSLAIAYKSAATLTSSAAWANRIYNIGTNVPVFGKLFSVYEGLSSAAILTAPINNPQR